MPLKNKGWTKAQRAKFTATMAAKRSFSKEREGDEREFAKSDEFTFAERLEFLRLQIVRLQELVGVSKWRD